MEEGRARSQTVTTTSSSYCDTFTTSANLSYDRSFLTTAPGLLLLAEIVFGLPVWALIAGSEYFLFPAFGWVMFVAVFYWVLTVFLLIIYMTRAFTRIPKVPWTLVSLCFYGSAFVLYLIAAVIDATSITKEMLDDHNYNSWTASAACLLIAFLCVRSSVWTDYSAYRYFEVITICFMILILILYAVSLFRIYRMLTCVSWPLTELLHYAICTILLLIGSIVAAVKSNSFGGLVAGSIFGFIATFLCTLGMVLSYKVKFITQSSGASV